MKQLIKNLKKILFKKAKSETTIKENQKSNIGENVRFMGENVLDKVNPHLISIGNHCVLGYRSSILTHGPIKGGLQVKIGDFVWLGFGVIVLPGSIIGNCTIVGGGSVVTKSFPDNVIIAGNPAKILRSLTEEEKDQLQFRLKHKLPMGKDNNA